MVTWCVVRLVTFHWGLPHHRRRRSFRTRTTILTRHCTTGLTPIPHSSACYNPITRTLGALCGCDEQVHFSAVLCPVCEALRAGVAGPPLTPIDPRVGEHRAGAPSARGIDAGLAPWRTCERPGHRRQKSHCWIFLRLSTTTSRGGTCAQTQNSA